MDLCGLPKTWEVNCTECKHGSLGSVPQVFCVEYATHVTVENFWPSKQFPATFMVKLCSIGFTSVMNIDVLGELRGMESNQYKELDCLSVTLAWPGIAHLPSLSSATCQVKATSSLNWTD